MSEMQAFETHLDRMEREAQRQKHELMLAEEKTKQMRLSGRFRNNENFWVVMGFGLGFLFILGFVYIVWLGVRGPDASDVHEEELAKMCYSSGGAWEREYYDRDERETVPAKCDTGN